HVGEGLIDYAERHGCDLVMAGGSDSGLLTRIFLGSTSRYVLRHARCSVMIVRDKHDRESAHEAAAQRNADRPAARQI
ncbi:MAG: universal stress protein, partial [Planctomycetaceae bacterium]